MIKTISILYLLLDIL